MSKIDKIDKTILSNFYKLVHAQPNVRLTAAASTYKILGNLKEKNPQKFNENLNYVVERLVSGLASSRGFARQGYGTLLLEILRAYQISTDRLFVIASQKFGQINRESSRDNLLGYYLLITIVMESKNYKKSKSNEQYLEKIYRTTVILMNTKSYLDIPTSNILIKDHLVFYPFMIEDIPQHAFGSDSRLTTKELLIILLCNKKEPLRELNNMDNQGVLNLFVPLTDEKLQRQPIHPIFMETCLFFSTHRPQCFDKFYTNIISPTFFKAKHNELASMGFKLTSDLLKSIDDTEIIKIILSEHLIKTVILSLRNRTSLYKPVLEFFEVIKASFALVSDTASAKAVNVDKQYTILLKLTTNPGSIAFDEDSKTSCLNSLLAVSNPATLKKYALRLTNVLFKTPSQSDRPLVQLSCARQIAHILRRTQLNDEKSFTCKLIKFLLVNSLFKFDINRDTDESFWKAESLPKPTRELEDSVIDSFRSSYHSGLEHMISVSDSVQRIQQLDELVNFTDKLFKLESATHIGDKSADNTKTEELWSLYKKVLAKHRKLVAKNEGVKLLYPITTLFLFYGLQIVEYSFDCSANLDELVQSSIEVLKADPADGSWADILTDQIIAILSATECKPWVRTLCVSVFGSLLPHISQTSIDILCDALKSTSTCDAGSDEECSGVDSEDDDSDEDDMSVDDESGECLSPSDEEDSSASADHLVDEVEPEVEHSSPFQRKKKKSSTSGSVVEMEGVDDESDDCEEEYLDDEQMMKLDSVIADMFKLNRATNNKKKDDAEFKLRCLDLIKKIVLKKHSDKETIDSILSTIIPLANRSSKLQETRPIKTKVISILSKMPGKNSNPKVAAFLKRQTG